jgi:hypothetical protein
MNLTTEGNLIEEYICNDKQIPYLSKKYGFHEHYVRNLVSKYFGTGKFKVTSSHKGTRRKSSIIKYSNLTNLKEVYEQERNRCR